LIYDPNRIYLRSQNEKYGIMKSANPTPSEFMVLQILWSDGPSTVKHVHKHLADAKDVGYTTTLKIMQVMTEKGLLTREIEGKRHIYAAAVEEEEIQDAMLDKFLNVTFRGSASKLVMKALGSGKTSKAELEKIKNFISHLDKK